MADEKEKGAPAPPPFEYPPAPVFPGQNVPSIAVDFVPSVYHAAGSVRFYLARLDPEVFGRGGQNITPVVQVALPLAGFANMVVFFSSQLEKMKESYPELPQIIADMEEGLRQQDAAKNATKT